MPVREPTNNLLLNRKMVSIPQPMFTVFFNTGCSGFAMLNTSNSVVLMVYSQSFIIVNLAMEPPTPTGETETLLWEEAALKKTSAIPQPNHLPPLLQSL